MGGDANPDPEDSGSKKSHSQQRYYLYDNELSRPKSTPGIPPPAPTSSGIQYEEPKFIPRGAGFRPRGGRLPFNRQTDYVGVYPSVKELEEDHYRKLYGNPVLRNSSGPGAPGSSNRIYSRPPDEYHGSRERERDSRRYDESIDRSRGRDYDHRHDYYNNQNDRDRRDHRDYYTSSSSRQSQPQRYWDSELARRSRTPRRTRSRSRSHDHEKHHHKESPNSPPPVPERDEYDLSIELHPLMHYIDDKGKLIDEAFGILQGKRLKAMIPPALKDLSPKELESLCREELKDISIATIANVIDGKIIPSAEVKKRKSESQDDSETVKKKKTNDLVKKVKKTLKEGTSKDKSPIKKKKKSKEGALVTKKSKVKGEGKKKKKKKKVKKGTGAEDDSGGVAPHKTLMELLELEFRAKAIKAMLKTQGLDTNKVDNALASDPETSTGENNVIEIPNPEQIIESKPPDPVAVASTSTDLKSPMPNSFNSNNVVIAASPDSSTTKIIVNASSNIESPIVVSSSLNEEINSSASSPEIPISPKSISEPEEEEEQIEKDENKSMIVEEVEELDYEDELEIHPYFNQDAVEPVEVEDKEDGEIRSGDESDDDNESLASHRSRSVSKSPILVQRRSKSSNRSDSEDDGERGGWRRSVSDSDSDTERRKKTRYKTQSPCPSQKSDKLSEVSNDEIKDDQEQNNSDDADSLYERVEAASPRVLEIEIESDLSGGFEEMEKKDNDDDADDGIIIGPMPGPGPASSSFKEVVVDDEQELENTCAEKPPDYVDEEEDVEEPKSSGVEDDEQEQDDDENLPRTWFNRWYNSKKVQKNVKSNKMIGRLRSKLRREKLIPDEPPKPNPVDEDLDNSVPIIGSIKEYEKLFSNPKYKYTVPDEATTDSNKEENIEESSPENDDEDEQDDENDELWKDIIGNADDDDT